MKHWLCLAALSVGLTACNSAISSFPPASHRGGVTPTGRALVVGGASGVVFNSLVNHYAVSTGTGAEEPSAFDLVVFDGNSTTPQALAANPAPSNFLSAGKAVLLLNNTETHRSIGFSGVLGGHVTGSSPATIFFIQRGKNGLPAGQVDIEFPKHVVAGILGKPGNIRPATTLELPNDAESFIASFKRRFGSSSTTTGPAPSFGPGTTTYSDDVVQALSISMPSSYTEITAPADFEWCDDVTTFNVWGACEPHTNPTTTDNLISANFETYINVLLEPSGTNGQQTYLHKVIARQYAYVDPQPFPANSSSWQTTVEMADSVNGTNNPNGPLTTMLGFNAAVLLTAQPTWSGVAGNPTMVITESQPTATNNTSQLTTSQMQTESVGVSAGGGYTAGGNGVLGFNWSDAWSWSTANTINITDWSSSSQTVSGPADLEYQFAATGNTPNTFANLQQAGIGGSPTPGYNPPQFGGLQLGPQYLNGLQSSGMVSQDETVWKGAGLVAPSPQIFQAYADFQIGEVYQFFDAQLNNHNYGNVGAALISEPISIDFSSPSLQPPSIAPWTLSFGAYKSTSQNYQQIVGTVALTRTAQTATKVFLSYVVQPQAQLLTRPINQACPGNSNSFNPGNDVINNGAPPLSVTIPAGQRSSNFTLSFEVFNSSTYNVQVVAWLPKTAISGANLVNPESAICLTPPNA